MSLGELQGRVQVAGGGGGEASDSPTQLKKDADVALKDAMARMKDATAARPESAVNTLKQAFTGVMLLVKRLEKMQEAGGGVLPPDLKILQTTLNKMTDLIAGQAAGAVNRGAGSQVVDQNGMKKLLSDGFEKTFGQPGENKTDHSAQVRNTLSQKADNLLGEVEEAVRNPIERTDDPTKKLEGAKAIAAVLADFSAGTPITERVNRLGGQLETTNTRRQ